MTTKPKVSVILVNWNGKKWLQKCIDSILNQDYPAVEIVLVDNASSDDSVAYVKKEYPEVTMVQSGQNLGFASGVNLGVRNASGELIMLLNSDTWIEKNFIYSLTKYFMNHAFDVIGPYEATYNGQHREPYRTQIDLLGHPVYRKDSSTGDKQKNFYLTGVCLLFRKTLYNESGGLDSNFFMYCEEVDWFWRLQLLGKKFCYVPNLYVNHAGAGSSEGGLQYRIFLWRNQNTLQMLLKNYKLQNLLWVLPLYFLQNLIEMVCLLFIRPRLARSYLEGWVFNSRNLNIILEKRAWVQRNRKTGDIKILGLMILFPGKLHHLINYIERRIKK